MKEKKTRKEILDKLYLNSQDLVQLGLTIKSARKVINEVQIQMELKGMYVPQTKTKLADTKMILKYLNKKEC